MNTLILPALHGRMGERRYYSVVMRLADIATRVNYAEEIHDSKELSEFIQRRLKESRASQIADYLQNNSERFFSSLVVAVYGGDPLWYDAGDISFSEGLDPKPTLPENIADRLGFLHLSGDEKLFALDGQHRLAGIRRAVNQDEVVANDLVSVLFVGHLDTDLGRIKTRRLFTVLNKHAKPVSKADIIALDEDDAPAIITRKLVGKGGLFSGKAVSFKASNQLAHIDRTSLITIVALYDSVKLLVEKLPHGVTEEIRRAKKKLERPDDEVLDQAGEHVEEFLRRMINHFSGLEGYFRQPQARRVVGHSRTRRGGNVLFRPVGFHIFVQVMVDLVASGMVPSNAIRLVSRLPVNLSQDPYRDVLWRPRTQRMDIKQKKTVTDVLRLAVGILVSDQRLRMLTRTLNDAYGHAQGAPGYLSSQDVRDFAESMLERTG